MTWTWLIFFLAGVSVGIIIGVLIDRDTLLKVGRIKIKGRGQHVEDVLDFDLNGENPPSRRQLRKINRLKKRFKK